MAVTMSRLGFTCDYGNYAHTFVSAATSSINVTGAGQTQPTGATYDSNTGLMTFTVANHGFPTPNSPATISTATYIPSTGVLTLTSTGHGLSDGDYVKLLPNSLTFTCEKDNHATEHSYPRVSDPAYNTWLQVSNVDTPNHKFDVNVGVSEYTAEHWFKSGTSNNLLRAETTISLDPESIVFTCDKDNHATQHSYPRAKDPSYNKILGVESVPNNNTFTVNVGVSTNDIFPDNNGNVFSVVSVPTTNSFTVYTGPNQYPHNYIGGGKVLLNVIRPFDGKVAYFDNQYYSIGSIKITNSGSGYNSPPTITIDSPTSTPEWGVDATAVATIFNGRVDEIELISNGRGYTSLPQVTFSAPDVGINTACLLFTSPSPRD